MTALATVLRNERVRRWAVQALALGTLLAVFGALAVTARHNLVTR